MTYDTKGSQQIRTTEIEIDSLKCVEALVDRQSFSQSYSTCFACRYTLKAACTHTHTAHSYILPGRQEVEI